MPSYKPSLPKISLEQWAAFRAVVEEGSFAKAADKLNKSQSSISYTLGLLAQQLPLPALQLSGRKAQLTAAGQVFYRQACQLLDAALALEAGATRLAQGWEAEVTIALDALVPVQPVLQACCLLARQNPATRVRLLETSLSGTDEALLSRQCQLAIMPQVPPGFWPLPLGAIRMLPVVSPRHPLAVVTGLVQQDQLREHRQIVLRDTGVKREQNAGWLGAEQRLTTSHFATSCAAVIAGLGFAFLPEHLIADAVEQGQLRVLSLAQSEPRVIGLSMVKTDGDLAGKAVEFLAGVLPEQFKVRQLELKT
jgi:DNA-binding transcriptional LysR family regulator